MPSVLENILAVLAQGGSGYVQGKLQKRERKQGKEDEEEKFRKQLELILSGQGLPTQTLLNPDEVDEPVPTAKDPLTGRILRGIPATPEMRPATIQEMLSRRGLQGQDQQKSQAAQQQFENQLKVEQFERSDPEKAFTREQQLQTQRDTAAMDRAKLAARSRISAGAKPNYTPLEVLKLKRMMDRGKAVQVDPIPYYATDNTFDFSGYEQALKKGEKQQAKLMKLQKEQEVLNRKDPQTGLDTVQQLSKAIDEGLMIEQEKYVGEYGKEMTIIQARAFVKKELKDALNALGLELSPEKFNAVYDAIIRASNTESQTQGGSSSGLLQILGIE